jgi:hypothetical protein
MIRALCQIVGDKAELMERVTKIVDKWFDDVDEDKDHSM